MEKAGLHSAPAGRTELGTNDPKLVRSAEHLSSCCHSKVIKNKLPGFLSVNLYMSHHILDMRIFALVIPVA